MQKIPHRSAGFFACIFFQCKLVREAGLEPARETIKCLWRKGFRPLRCFCVISCVICLAGLPGSAAPLSCMMIQTERKEIVMPIKENVSAAIYRYQRGRDLSLREVAREFGIPWASLEGYANGRANPRADTLELLAKKLEIPLTELVSGSPPGWEQAETLVDAAVAIGSLPPEHREECVELLLRLIALFSIEDYN